MSYSIKRTFSRARSPQPPKATPSISSTLTPASPSTISETPKQSANSIRNSPSPSPAQNQSSTRQNVKVTVRVRPPNAVEMSRGETEVWEIDNKLQKLSILTDYCERYRKQVAEYFYDAVFTGSNNKILFEKGVRDTVRSTMEGYNGTVFAYGQTSSDDGTDSQPGVIPQAVDCVFSYIRECQEKEFLLRVSYMEIYNETVRDLLSPETEDLRIHEDKRRGVYVSPLKEVVVSTPKQVLKEIMKGEANRHMSATDWNERSSRSHTIFQMVIESTAKGSSPPTSHRYSAAGPKMSGTSVSLSVLNLIDLAGSEKATTSMDRRKEGAFINKSLLTLGTVISKLTDNNGGHIPFRDSKLTRILQNSLSGNARVSVICTISPSAINIEESQNTLKFAARVKKVVTKAHTNAVMDDKALLQKYRIEIEELKAKLEITNVSNDKENDKEKETELSQMLAQEKAKHEEQMMEAQLVRTALKERIDHLTKLILNNSSFSGSQSRKVLVEPNEMEQTNNLTTNPRFEKQIEEKDAKLALLTSELDNKNKIIEQLTTELNAAKRTTDIKEQRDVEKLQKTTQELEIVIEELQEKIRILENGKKGHSRNGSGRDFIGSTEHVELRKTIQRQREFISELEEEIKSNRNIIAIHKEMLHKAELSQLQSKTMNRTNGRHMENGTYNVKQTDKIKSANSDNIGNDRNDDVLLKNGLIISDEAILIFLLFTFSNFITVG
ncbi:18316_t:CDS:10 [Funneliformis geosporum]|uniref:Kinesin-like protein n=1 Tax=Funneliformis geosporum TaxID=1117311 RepID=A0A9W4SJD0_9GLOM|nr:18316_t:CDS:10 [Funneliformis geosporum]CAI2172041.1 19433_t:CDS:10 [Funneliformis geosporum]